MPSGHRDLLSRAWIDQTGFQPAPTAMASAARLASAKMTLRSISVSSPLES
jgi:hypothetical protein